MLETQMTDHDAPVRDPRPGDVPADFADLRKDVAKLSETVTQLVKARADAAGHSVADAVGSAKETLAASAAQASHRVSGLGAELEATIERNPLTSVLVALSIGLVAGMMSHSRR
jgi:ElaB/YqjD/DUF883 family membrane-anchored ribosome-binding protein